MNDGNFWCDEVTTGDVAVPEWEGYPRTAEFTEGRPCVDDFGFAMFLPVLGPESYDDHPSIRRFFELLLDHWEADEVSPGSSDPLEMIRALRVVTCELLQANYCIDDELAGSIAGSLPPVGKPGLDPSTAALDALAELGDTYRTFAGADRKGLDRVDALALLASPLPHASETLVGWFNHDGALFEN